MRIVHVVAIALNGVQVLILVSNISRGGVGYLSGLFTSFGGLLMLGWVLTPFLSLTALVWKWREPVDDDSAV